MDSRKINIKDVSTIGIFSAVLFAITILVGALTGSLLELHMFSVAIIAFVSAPVYYLIMAKVHKKGMVISTCAVVGILWGLMGGIPVLLSMILCGIIGEFVLTKVTYKSFAGLTVTYILYIIGYYGGAIAPLYYWKDFYYRQGRPAEVVDELIKASQSIYAYISIPMMVVMAIAGAFLARKILKKHFERAGVL